VGAFPLCCYAASPCGFAESTRFWYDYQLLPTLRRFYGEVIDPFRQDQSQDPELIAERNFRAIRERADLVVAVLDGSPPDEGTVIEVIWAALWGVPVIAYRSDFRTSGELGLPYNLMVRGAVRISGGVEVTTFKELERAARLFAQGAGQRPGYGRLERIAARITSLTEGFANCSRVSEFW
jgi:nucleoside 2-deoxyribosyltransferase